MGRVKDPLGGYSASLTGLTRHRREKGSDLPLTLVFELFNFPTGLTRHRCEFTAETRLIVTQKQRQRFSETNGNPPVSGQTWRPIRSLDFPQALP
jgi:hypothetical protein